MVTTERQPQRLSFAPTVYVFLATAYFLVDPDSIVRDAIYIVPALLVISQLSTGGIRIAPNESAYALITWVYLLFTTLMGGVDLFSAREFSFISLSGVVFVLSYQVRHQFLLQMLSAAILVVVVLTATQPQAQAAVSIFQSNGLAETEFGLILPIVGLAFYLRRQTVFFLLTLLVGMVMFKRIAVVALLVAILWDLSFLAGKRTEGTGATILRIAAACLVLLGASVSLQSPQLFEVVAAIGSSIGDTTLDPNVLSSGRYNVLREFERALLATNTPVQWLFGHGAGASTRALAESALLRFENYGLLHNDWLRILADYGVVGAALVAIGFWKALLGGRLTSLVAVYTLVLFMTDNVATYLIYWVGVAFVIRSASEHSPSDATRRRRSA